MVLYRVLVLSFLEIKASFFKVTVLISNTSRNNNRRLCARGRVD